VDEHFAGWIEAHYPERAAHVLGRIRDTRGGKISDSTFGRRQRGAGAYAEQIAQLFAAAAKRHGLAGDMQALETRHFRRGDPGGQLSLL
jgi:DNA repair photolyase